MTQNNIDQDFKFPETGTGFLNSRRAFIKNGFLLITSSAVILNSSTDVSSLFAQTQKQKPVIKLGLLTDLHFADKEHKGNRYYRETPQKLKEASELFKKEKLDFIVELGDLIDSGETLEIETEYLKTINRQFSELHEKRYCVLGNHCVESLKKEEFLKIVDQKKSWFSFDHKDFHFVVLDSCYNSKGEDYGRRNFTWNDTNIPHQELNWLKEDLKNAAKPTIVFAHQRLDVTDNHGVKNCEEVRKVLEGSGNVLVVFQGHSHKNDLNTINNIQYCTLVAMIEGTGESNNGYSFLEIFADKTLVLHGFRNQKNQNWNPNA